MRKESIRLAFRKNEQKPCSVQGCHNNRYQINSTCKHHYFMAHAYGHPLSKAIQPKEMGYELAQVNALIDRNIETHIGLQKAAAFIDTWISNAVEDKQGTVQARQIRRLGYNNIRGLEVIKVCAAVWLYSERNPKYFMANKSLSYALAHQTMRLVPLERIITSGGKRRPLRMNATSRKEIGGYLRDNLGLLFVNICDSIQKLEQVNHEMKQAMGAAFIAH
ncbi:MAG TPA: hypothetical protein P5098_00355 [Candidatus Dojkabacteria bacterium]|nr:hypothetical protein [Candidatus Dojkabacteria bacterium]